MRENKITLQGMIREGMCTTFAAAAFRFLVNAVEPPSLDRSIFLQARLHRFKLRGFLFFSFVNAERPPISRRVVKSSCVYR